MKRRWIKQSNRSIFGGNCTGKSNAKHTAMRTRIGKRKNNSSLGRISKTLFGFTDDDDGKSTAIVLRSLVADVLNKNYDEVTDTDIMWYTSKHRGVLIDTVHCIYEILFQNWPKSSNVYIKVIKTQRNSNSNHKKSPSVATVSTDEVQYDQTMTEWLYVIRTQTYVRSYIYIKVGR